MPWAMAAWLCAAGGYPSFSFSSPALALAVTPTPHLNLHDLDWEPKLMRRPSPWVAFPWSSPPALSRQRLCGLWISADGHGGVPQRFLSHLGRQPVPPHSSVAIISPSRQ
jgi:hypothetical protein